MRVSNDVLLKKIDLVVNKLMNLGAPEVEGDLSDKNTQEKGMIVRDFRYPGVGLAPGRGPVWL